MKKKVTYDDYLKANNVVEEYQKGVHTFFRKDGIKYIRCEHLKNKTQLQEWGLLWIGDNTRIVMCGICLNAERGNFMRLLDIIPKEVEPSENEKRVIEYEWKDNLRNFFKGLLRPIDKQK